MKIDYTPELTQLLKFAGDTATAIRMYSKYGGGTPRNGNQYRDSAMAPVDLMFLSDAISQLLNIGGAIERGNPEQIVDTCHSVQKLFESYATDNPTFDPQAKPTFDYWAGLVDLGVAVMTLKGIQAKTVAAGFPKTDLSDLTTTPLTAEVVLGNCQATLPMQAFTDVGHSICVGPTGKGMSSVEAK